MKKFHNPLSFICYVDPPKTGETLMQNNETDLLERIQALTQQNAILSINHSAMLSKVETLEGDYKRLIQLLINLWNQNQELKK